MEKWLVIGRAVGQGKYKISLGHLVVPENTAVLKRKKHVGMSRGHGSP